MLTSRKLAHAMLALFALVVMSSFALAADPGLIYPPTSEASDQKAGSMLIYNIYTSGTTSGNAQNARINITNTSTSSAAFVHLFFVAEGCGIADSYICLSATQTSSFLASDIDPGTTGYIVAVATDQDGLPAIHNFLIGDEYVKFSAGHSGNLGAVAFAKLTNTNVVSADGSLAALFFDGLLLAGSYNRVARTLAEDNLGSRADGNDTLIIINRIGGNLGIGAATLGTLSGLLYDDAENVLSFTVTGSCQYRQVFSGTNVRTAPRFETFIPAGRTGWIKFSSQSDIGILGAALNANPNTGTSAGAFGSGHNLHHLTLSAAASYVIPVFPPSC